MIRHPLMMAACLGAALLAPISASAQRGRVTLGQPTFSPRGTLKGGTALIVRVRASARGGRVTAVGAWIQVGNSRGGVVNLQPVGTGTFATSTTRVQVPANTTRRTVRGYLYVRAVTTVGSATQRVAINIAPGDGDSNRPPEPPNI